jgi:hypothetical protein
VPGYKIIRELSPLSLCISANAKVWIRKLNLALAINFDRRCCYFPMMLVTTSVEKVRHERQIIRQKLRAKKLYKNVAYCMHDNSDFS